MTDIPKLHYSYRTSMYGEGVPEGGARVQVFVDDNVVFEEVVTHSWQAEETINAYVKAQGWMTYREWWAKYPLRYKIWVDEDRSYDSTISDQVCTDRLTGVEIFRYDLGDPANWSSDYGGISNDERFERRGLNRRERVCVDDCVVKD